MKTITCERIKYSSERLITITTTKRSWFGLGKQYTTVKRYRGRSTVWRNADTGVRQSTLMESYLSDIYTKAKWDEEEKKSAF